jgi:tetratricopeptide (TPR) repeat protein
LLSLGSLYSYTGKPGEARAFVEQALPFYQKGGYRREVSQAYTILGHASDHTGDYDAALQAFEQQLLLSESVKDLSQVALSHLSIGIVLSHKEDYTKALYHFDQSYKAYESLDVRLNAGHSLANRGNMLWQLGRYQEAQEALAKASSLIAHPGEGYTELSAKIHLSNARMALSQRRFQLANAESQKALGLSGNEYKSIALEATFTLGLAQALSGAVGQGKVLLDQAIAAAMSTDDLRLLPAAKLSMAEALVESDAKTALMFALQAQERFGQLGSPASEWRAWFIAARACKRTGDEALARDYASRAVKLLSSLDQIWEPEAYNIYITRPDVQQAFRQFSDEFAIKVR